MRAVIGNTIRREPVQHVNGGLRRRHAGADRFREMCDKERLATRLGEGRDGILDPETWLIDPATYHPIARMQSPNWYARTRDMFELKRPR